MLFTLFMVVCIHNDIQLLYLRKKEIKVEDIPVSDLHLENAAVIQVPARMNGRNTKEPCWFHRQKLS